MPGKQTNWWSIAAVGTMVAIIGGALTIIAYPMAFARDQGVNDQRLAVAEEDIDENSSDIKALAVAVSDLARAIERGDANTEHLSRRVDELTRRVERQEARP